MTDWSATITIRPKPGLRDPEGATISDALHSLGWTDVDDVHMGRTISLSIESETLATAQNEITSMCDQILANPAIEQYTIHISESARQSA